MSKKNDLNRMTAKEVVLVEYIISHPEVSELRAAMACGWKEGSANQLLNRPRVRQAIDKALAAKTAAVVKAAAKKAVITKSIIEERAMQIANMDPALDTKGNATAQVNALRLLAEMNGHIVQKTQDLTEEMRNKTEEDKEHFIIHGYWPGMEPGEPSAIRPQGSTPSTEKPN